MPTHPARPSLGTTASSGPARGIEALASPGPKRYADKAKKTPMRAGDILPIGSTTKTYTAVLVMRLVAQGKVALDAPVSKYLPGLLPDGKRITIRQLLSHTTGLDDFASDTRFVALYLQGNFGYAWTPRQMVAFAASQPRAFAPGTKFAYSNTNYIVLAVPGATAAPSPATTSCPSPAPTAPAKPSCS